MQDSSKQTKRYVISVLSDIIKTHRKDLNKTVYMISAEASVPRSTWRDIEFGMSNDLNLTNFCKIAEGLEVSPDVLLRELLEKLGKDFSFIDLDN